MKRFLRILAVFCFAVNVFAQTSAIWDGTIDAEWYWENTEQTEYVITTGEQLAGLAQLVNGGHDFKGKIVKLGANIMLNDTTNWKNWGKRKCDEKTWQGQCIGELIAPSNIWTTIGSYKDENNNRKFLGSFYGDGHTVSGIYINNKSDYQGLFAYVGVGTIIQNLSIKASLINGKGSIGGLAGISYGTITNCYIVAYILGNGSVGGLLGTNISGKITNCYSNGYIEGYSHTDAGGLIGRNYDGIIIDCYTLGNIVGVSDVIGGGNVGGLIGINGSQTTGGTITNCYTKGKIKGGNGLVGKNFGKITHCYTTGNIENGNGLVSENYDSIANCYTTGNIKNGNGLVGINGNYKIKNTTIINCYSTGNIEDGDGLVSGNYGTITNCYATGNVKNGNGFLEYSYGTITNCYATGNVIEGSGLLEHNLGTITNCYATGNIINEKTYYSGGLVGNNSDGKIINCYATGNVIAKSNAGGLVGGNFIGVNKVIGTIINCYATGNVSGGTGNTIGGLVGINDKGVITTSFYNRQTSGQVDINKGVPKSTAQMKLQETFENWDFEKIWAIDENKNNGYPYLREIEK